MCKLPESDFIKERVDATKEAIHFISNDCKSDSEIWKEMLKEVALRGRIW
jgi:hypothetical protein